MKSLKPIWWWLSDAAWRKEYTATTRRVRAFRKRQHHAVAKLVNHCGGRILSGPFSGMMFTPALRSGACCAQVLLGTYELELRSIIEAVCDRPYARVVVLGASEGYYLCGLKYRNPTCHAIGYELDASKHAAIRDLAVKNGIDAGIEVRGRGHVGALRQDLVDPVRMLVICDVDGAEEELLDVESVPELLKADILVETHDLILPGITDKLRSRFQSTHDIETVTSRNRTLTDAPPDLPLTPSEALASMDEFRGGQQYWLWMKARTN